MSTPYGHSLIPRLLPFLFPFVRCNFLFSCIEHCIGSGVLHTLLSSLPAYLQQQQHFNRILYSQSLPPRLHSSFFPTDCVSNLGCSSHPYHGTGLEEIGYYTSSTAYCVRGIETPIRRTVLIANPEHGSIKVAEAPTDYSSARCLR